MRNTIVRERTRTRRILITPCSYFRCSPGEFRPGESSGTRALKIPGIRDGNIRALGLIFLLLPPPPLSLRRSFSLLQRAGRYYCIYFAQACLLLWVLIIARVEFGSESSFGRIEDVGRIRMRALVLNTSIESCSLRRDFPYCEYALSL